MDEINQSLYNIACENDSDFIALKKYYYDSLNIIRSSKSFASILSFLYTFQNDFHFSHCTAEELELGIIFIDKKIAIPNIMWHLLYDAKRHDNYNIDKLIDIDPYGWQKDLLWLLQDNDIRQRYFYRIDELWSNTTIAAEYNDSGTLALNEFNIKDLIISQRLLLIDSLCDWKLFENKELLNNLHDLNPTVLRVEPIGYDALGHRYWHLNDDPYIFIEQYYNKEIDKYPEEIKQHLIQYNKTNNNNNNKLSIELIRKKSQNFSAITTNLDELHSLPNLLLHQSRRKSQKLLSKHIIDTIIKPLESKFINNKRGAIRRIKYILSNRSSRVKKLEAQKLKDLRIEKELQKKKLN